jgi:hypothetical protein
VEITITILMNKKRGKLSRNIKNTIICQKKLIYSRRKIIPFMERKYYKKLALLVISLIRPKQRITDTFKLEASYFNYRMLY